MGDSRTRVKLGVKNELVVPVVLVPMYIDIFIKLIHTAERSVVPHRFMPVPILMLPEAKSETWIDKSDPHLEVVTDSTLYVTPTR